MAASDLTTPRSIAPAAARLVMVEGPHVGERFNLAAESVLGRSVQSDVCVEDVGVSRKHAEVKRADDGVYVVRDLKSKNGTFVNGRKIEQHTLTPGDQLKLGPRATFVFSYLDPLEEEMRQKQRLETLGRALAGIAHDLNNVVGALAANADFLGRMNPEATFKALDVTAALEDMKLGALQARNLTRSVVNFARGKPTSFGFVDMSELASDTIRLARHALGRNVKVAIALEPKLVVRGSQSELQQTLMNLIVNARDAMPKGGKLCLRARALKGSECEKTLDLDPEQTYVVVEVEDTGVGISKDVLNHIFEPFFTTKGHGSGSGIGLATVKDVVGLHKGRVGVESVPGLGTTFRMYLPRADVDAVQRKQSTGAMRAYDATAANAHLGKLILIVDDDPLARRSLSRLLAREHYQVAVAENGQQALQRYREYPQPDLVLMDLDMPGMSGEEACRELLRLDRSAQVVLCTGRVDIDSGAPGAGFGAVATLHKPFSGDTLRATLSTLFAQASSLDDELTQRHENPRLDG